MASLPLDVFMDRENYLLYTEISELILTGRLLDGILVVLFNEPLWLLINIAMGRILTPEQSSKCLIFLPAALVAFSVLRHGPRYFFWLVVFLFLPNVVKNHIIHLRQGLAIALFITAWHLPVNRLKWVIIWSTPFIHAAFFFVVSLIALDWLVTKLNLAGGVRSLVYAWTGIIVGMSMKFLGSAFGVHQAEEYEFAMAQVSGTGFLFWLFILCIFLAQGNIFLRKYSLATGSIVFYLSTYFLVEVTARIFESLLLIVLLAGLELTGVRRSLFLYSMLLFGAVNYALQWGSPWLGFGV